MHDDQPSPPRGPRQVAIIGAGKAGTALARVLIDAGHTVTLTGSAGPEAVEPIASILAPGSIPARLEPAVSASDVVVLSLPLHRVSDLDPRLFAGKIVVDAMNYWPPVNGTLACLEETETGSSELIQEQLPGARVVKAFNHTGYHDSNRTAARPAILSNWGSRSPPTTTPRRIPSQASSRASATTR